MYRSENNVHHPQFNNHMNKVHEGYQPLAISSRPNVIEAVALHVTRAGQIQASLMLADGGSYGRWLFGHGG